MIFAELAKKTSASYGTQKYIKIQNTTTLEATPKQMTPVRILIIYFSITHLNIKKLNSVALVRERTIPTERLPPVGEVSANFCG
jgi:hypothetical protein